MEGKPLLETLNASEDDLTFELYLLRSLLNYWQVADTLMKEQKVSVQQVVYGDRGVLEQEIAEEVKQVYKAVLSHLETGLASKPELYNKMRPVVLRAGNDAIRNIAKIISNYHALKIADSKTVVIYKAEE